MTSYFWDFLRPLTDFATQIDPYIKIVVMLLAFAMFLVAFFAYQKNKSKKLLFVTGAFFFFAAKWFFKVIDIFVSPGIFLADPSENMFELIILVLLFFAILKK